MIRKESVNKNISLVKVTREYHFDCGPMDEAKIPLYKTDDYNLFYTKLAEEIIENYPEINEFDTLVVKHHQGHEMIGAYFIVLRIEQWNDRRTYIKTPIFLCSMI